MLNHNRTLVNGFRTCWRRHQSSQETNGANSNENSYIWRKPEGQYTGINVYNHTLRRKVPLVLRNPHLATWYTCGPTVYDSSHLGHASTYVKVDIIQRILRDHFKINLVTAMNITDVDDKIIKRCRETGKTWQELTRAYDEEFKQDMSRLNVMPPDFCSHVSTNMPEILRFIAELLVTEQAYVSEDKSVYFNVSKYPYYGKLQKLNMSANEQKELIEQKNSAADFALWKAQKNKDEPSWETPWGGYGRPGWHIECSAIAGQFAGNQLDFHAGGLDLRFPHHENEEAQCCARYRTNQWVNYWLHTGQLYIKGETEKMSKSLGNTTTISALLEHYTADEFRMACLLSNYRNSMSYSEQLMLTARQTLKKFKNFYADMEAYTSFLKPIKLFDRGALKAQLTHATTEYDNCLRDDFDTARAISVLMDQMSSISRCINEQQDDAKQDPAQCLDLLLGARNFIYNAMQNFGIRQQEVTAAALATQMEYETAPNLDINALVGDVLVMRGKLREQAMDVKNQQLLQVCDELRNLLQNHGIQIRDHKQGSSWVHKGNVIMRNSDSNSGSN